MIFLQHEKGWDNMLTKTRQKEILKLLENRGSVTLQELKDHLNTSESTIRRDLNTLDAQGKLVKVFGGAVAADNMSIRDEQVSRREEKNLEEKRLIARYAASLIQDDDFVYLDAGTPTGCMLDYISDATTAVFVTNAPSHAQKLARKGMEVILIGGRLKQSTEAVVGEEACRQIEKFNFSLGFLGSNGVSERSGFSTPDQDEAMVKKRAIERIHRCFVLCDHTKFYKVSPISFAKLEDAVVLTDSAPQGNFQEMPNIVEISEDE